MLLMGRVGVVGVLETCESLLPFVIVIIPGAMSLVVFVSNAQHPGGGGKKYPGDEGLEGPGRELDDGVGKMLGGDESWVEV